MSLCTVNSGFLYQHSIDIPPGLEISVVELEGENLGTSAF